MQEALKKEKIDYALFINTEIKDPNIKYFTGLDLEYSFLLIPKQGDSLFLVSALEHERAKKYSIIKNVKQYKKPLLEIKKIIKEKKVIGLNENYITISTDKALKKNLKIYEQKPIQEICKAIRIIKTREEINALQKAARIADTIFVAVCKELKTNIKKYKTEKNIAEFIEQQAKKYADGISFETIVASGKNAAMPHYYPQAILLQRGFCLLDFGVRYKNYISDISRTIFFGAPTEEEKEAYEKVRKANKNAIEALKIGRKCCDIDALSRKEFTYPHSLGHGIGVEVHESPSFSPKSKDVIKENMCFTIEPGMYVHHKYGIRIEDDVWMTKKGPVLLTKSTKELLCFF